MVPKLIPNILVFCGLGPNWRYEIRKESSINCDLKHGWGIEFEQLAY